MYSSYLHHFTKSFVKVLLLFSVVFHSCDLDNSNTVESLVYDGVVYNDAISCAKAFQEMYPTLADDWMGKTNKLLGGISTDR